MTKTKLNVCNKIVYRTNHHTCDAAVKALFEAHTKCNRVSRSSMFKRLQINRLLGIEKGLEDANLYRVCHKISNLINIGRKKNMISRAKVVSPPTNCTSPNFCQSLRLTKTDQIVSPVARPSPRKRVHMRHTRGNPKPFVTVKI